MRLFFVIIFYLVFSSSFSQIRPTHITVAKDGTGDYTTIQDAVNACRDLGYVRVTIFIKKGIYNEKLAIPEWKTMITLKGEQRDSTIISYNDYSGKPISDVNGNNRHNTFTSYTVLISGNDITLENITIQNTAGRVGQAVALHVEGDRVQVNNCNLLGNQDTLYASKEGSRQYYTNCLVEGTVDFIFGEATAVFENCTIKSLTNSFITAASTRGSQKFGFVFRDCKLVAGPEANGVYLGRPWRSYAKTVFIHCELGKHIKPEGWDAWTGDAMFPDKEKTTFYAEYKNFGEGADTTKRVAWSKQLTDKEAKMYTIKNIFGDWNPSTTN
jgi:pectinesterase